MAFKKLTVLLAVAALIASILACSFFSSGPSTSNFYMASDQNGQNKTTTFSSNQDFYAFFDVSGIQPGTKFEAQWYALNVQGQDPTKPFQTTDYTYQSGISTIYFQLTNSGGWPAGNYKVQIFMSGSQIGELTFSVQ